MPTIITRLKEYALGAMGLEDISHGPNDLEARILLDANRAIQEISLYLDDSFHFEEPRGTYVQPFVSTTVDATKGSTTIANLSGSASWMNGCSCQIDGASQWNRLRKTNAGAFELSRPFLGTTGTGLSIRVYHDCIHLPDDVKRIREPVRFDDDLMQPETVERLLGDEAFTRQVGRPTRYAERSIHAGDSAAPSLALLLNQLPAGGSEVRYTAVGSIRNFESLDDTREHVVPHDLEASCLFPIFLFYFSGYRLFVESKQDAMTDYQAAQRALQRLPKGSTTPRELKRPKR